MTLPTIGLEIGLMACVRLKSNVLELKGIVCGCCWKNMNTLAGMSALRI